MNLTQEIVREHMRYDNGKLFWKKSGSGVTVGAEVGCLHSTGYRKVRFRGINTTVHRLIFLHHYGYLPENQIDHINRIRDDNRIENLREVSQSCNLRNMKLASANTSGIKGISYYKPQDKWLARIMVNNKSRHLGYHTTKLEAACARLAAEQCLDWQACDSNSSAYKYVMENL